NLRPGQAAKQGMTDFIRDAGFGQLPLSPADRADLGAGIDPGRDIVHHDPRAWLSENVRAGESPLHVGGARQRRKADDVADGVNVGQHCLKILVDLQVAAAVRDDADSVESQLVGVAGPAVGPQQDLSLELLPRFEMQYDAVLLPFDFYEFLAMADENALFAQ